jgi:Zn-dependent M28 family amino/carboxypeptidase
LRPLQTGATFAHTLKLCLFTGEEQGLIGSRFLAAQMAEEGATISL